MDTTGPPFRELLAYGRQQLDAAGIESAALDAAVLLAHAAGLTRTSLYARLPERANAPVTAAYDDLLRQRAQGIPVAYLVGTKEFLGLNFAVTPATLVPRPETEVLVGWAEARLAAHPDTFLVADVGTGSGAIAVSLAARHAEVRVAASDTSMAALRVAQANARRHGVAARVWFVRGDLLAWLGQPLSLMLANLPYLTDVQASDAGIAAEPYRALAGGDADGFALYRRLIPQVRAHLAPGGGFAFEIDPAQVDIARALCRAIFPGAAVTARDDLAGYARVITVET